MLNVHYLPSIIKPRQVEAHRGPSMYRLELPLPALAPPGSGVPGSVAVARDLRNAVHPLSTASPPDGAKLGHGGPQGNNLAVLTTGQLCLMASWTPSARPVDDQLA